jgi:hypothetical protein
MLKAQTGFLTAMVITVGTCSVNAILLYDKFYFYGFKN